MWWHPGQKWDREAGLPVEAGLSLVVSKSELQPGFAEAALRPQTTGEETPAAGRGNSGAWGTLGAGGHCAAGPLGPLTWQIPLSC